MNLNPVTEWVGPPQQQAFGQRRRVGNLGSRLVISLRIPALAIIQTGRFPSEIGLPVPSVQAPAFQRLRRRFFLGDIERSGGLVKNENDFFRHSVVHERGKRFPQGRWRRPVPQEILKTIGRPGSRLLLALVALPENFRRRPQRFSVEGQQVRIGDTFIIPLGVEGQGSTPAGSRPPHTDRARGSAATGTCRRNNPVSLLARHRIHDTLVGLHRAAQQARQLSPGTCHNNRTGQRIPVQPHFKPAQSCRSHALCALASQNQKPNPDIGVVIIQSGDGRHHGLGLLRFGATGKGVAHRRNLDRAPGTGRFQDQGRGGSGKDLRGHGEEKGGFYAVIRPVVIFAVKGGAGCGAVPYGHGVSDGRKILIHQAVAVVVLAIKAVFIHPAVLVVVGPGGKTPQTVVGALGGNRRERAFSGHLPTVPSGLRLADPQIQNCPAPALNNQGHVPLVVGLGPDRRQQDKIPARRSGRRRRDKGPCQTPPQEHPPK